MSGIRRVVVITGVPGVGKTTISRIVSCRLGCPLIEISELAKDEDLITGYDEVRGTGEVDLEGVERRVSEIIEASEEPLVVEGHFAYDVVPREAVSHAFVLRRAPWVLQKELKARGYSDEKVRENVEAELIDVCLVEAVEALNPEVVCEVDTTGISPDEAADEVLAIMEGRKPCRRGLFDWLGWPEARELLEG